MPWQNENRMVARGKMGVEKCFPFKGVNARASTRIWAYNARRLACRPSRDALFKTQIHLTRVQSAFWANHPLLIFQRSPLFSHTLTTLEFLLPWLTRREKGVVDELHPVQGRHDCKTFNMGFLWWESESLQLQTRVVNKKAKYDFMTTWVLVLCSMTISWKLR